MSHDHHQPPGSRWRSPFAIALLGFLAVAAFFLLAEHRAHLLGALPFLLVALCPLLHFFGHRGHGGHHGPDRSESREDKP